MSNCLVWCDIPVVDLDRAMSFYSAVLGDAVQAREFSGMKFALLPGAESASSGCLYISSTIQPSTQGPLIYLNCNGRLDEAVAQVAPHGGRVLEPKQSIGPHGFRAVVLDSEGNRIALHST